MNSDATNPQRGLNETQPFTPDDDSAARKQGSPNADTPSSAHQETAAYDLHGAGDATHPTSPLPETLAAPASKANQRSGGAGSNGSPSIAPQLLSGRYKINKLLGHGGMGSVYLAHDAQLDRPVALKIPRLANDESGNLIQRFFREARAVATLNHPHICPIYDVGQDGDTYYIAMGYIEGRPLADYIASGKPQPQRQVATVVRKIAIALHEAHEKGVLHRDLKPANIMVDRRGEPIVMDFGLACRVDSEAETRLTQDGTIIGTPAYMSPEQIDRRGQVGPASDVYSLGVVLYELLAGKCPFQGNVVSVIGQVLHSEPKPVAEIRADVDPVLAEICSRTLAKDPAARYPSMKEFAKALTAYLKNEGAVDTQTALEPLAAAPLADLDDLLAEAATSPGLLGSPLQIPAYRAPGSGISAQMKWIFAAGAACLLVLAGLAIATALSGSHDVPQAKGPTADETNGSAADLQSGAVGNQTSRNGKITDAQPIHAAGNSGNNVARIKLGAGDTTRISTGETESVNDPNESPGELKSVPAVEKPVEPEDNDSDARPTSPATLPEPADDSVPKLPAPAETPARPLPTAGPEGHQFPDLKNLKVSMEAIPKLFEEWDRNGDEQIDGQELPLHVIERADRDNDQKLSSSELRVGYYKQGKTLFGPPGGNPPREGGPKRPPPPGPRPGARPGPPRGM